MPVAWLKTLSDSQFERTAAREANLLGGILPVLFVGSPHSDRQVC